MELEAGRKEIIAIRRERMQSLFELKYKNGGELPKELQGGYTSRQAAEAAAEKYLSNKNRIVTKKAAK